MDGFLKEVLCANCRSINPYEMHVEQQIRERNGKKYTFNKRIAICNNCGHRVTVPGLADLNEEEFEKVVRESKD